MEYIIRKIKSFMALAAAFSLILLTGCGLFGSDTGEAAPEEELQEESQAAEAESQPSDIITTITLWDCLEPRERMALMESRDSFLSSHGDINIEARHFRSQEELEDQFEAASLAGAGPQLLLLDLDGVYRLAPSNVVREIVDEVDYALVLDGLREISSYNGSNYVVPFRAYDMLVFIYNRELVEEVPVDFEGIFSYIQQLDEKSQEQEDTEEAYGFLLNESQADWIIPFVGGYNGWIIDYASNSFTLDSSAMERTLEFLDYAYNQQALLTGGLEYGEISDLFRTGSAHMIIDYYHMAEGYEESGIDVGLAKIPRVWEGTRNPTPLISGLGFMININTYDRQLEAARDFISFMISEDVQTSWNRSTSTLPALTVMEEGQEIAMTARVREAFEQAETCRGKPYDQFLMVIRNAIDDNVKNLLAGDIVPADAVLKIQEDAIRLRSGITPLEEDEQEGEVPEEEGETGAGDGNAAGQEE